MCKQDDQNGRCSFQHKVFQFGEKKTKKQQQQQQVLSVINQDELPKFNIKNVQNERVATQQQLPQYNCFQNQSAWHMVLINKYKIIVNFLDI